VEEAIINISELAGFIGVANPGPKVIRPVLRPGEMKNLRGDFGNMDGYRTAAAPKALRV